jgi:hypothetical protein
MQKAQTKTIGRGFAEDYSAMANPIYALVPMLFMMVPSDFIRCWCCVLLVLLLSSCFTLHVALVETTVSGVFSRESLK